MRSRRTTLFSLAAALALAACSGSGDDAAPATSVAPPVSTAVIATATTNAPRTSSTTTRSPPALTTGSASTAVPTSAAPTTAATTIATTTAAPTTTDPLVPPAVEADAYAVFDMRAGRMLASSEADAQRPVGSLMKLLAAHVAYANGDPTRIVRAPDGLVLAPSDESLIGIQPGQEFSRDTLIRAMLKVSANDAARMLAIDIAGSEAAYAAVMNADAAGLGLANTHAVNVTGLDADGAYSSANDVVRLGVTLMGNITFQQTVKESSATLNGQAFPNTNDLLGVYPGADGIKTGHTTDAGWCILASATHDGRRIVAAVLGAPTEAARDDAATALLDWGFTQP